MIACKGDPNVKKQKYLESGNRYLDKKQFKEASIQYQNAIQIDPNFATAHYKLAQAYLGTGNFRGAFTELRKTVDLKPDDLQAQLDIGNIYVLSGNWFEAEQAANQVLSKDPNSAGPTLYWLT
jgi:tetratricopeptide (TPR) repeat protein